MAQFEAIIRLFDLEEPDAPAAMRVLEERLRATGFTRWQVANLRLQAAVTPAVRGLRPPMRTEATYAGGGLLVAAVVVWTLWFLWVLAG